MSEAAPAVPLRLEDLLARIRAREEFSSFARRDEAQMDLVEGALLVAREEYPRLDAAAYRLRLNGMAAAVRGRASAGADAPRLLAALNDILFREEGFRPDRETYYDPRNSYLNEVIDRRQGIPLTLSLVYLEVGRRAGLPLHGVNFPGHFLVHCWSAGEEVLIDAYHDGARVSREECAARLRYAQGSGARLEPRLLEPAPPRHVLYRLLNNLKSVYMRSHETGRALACVERMLMLVPDSPVDLRDRGILLFHLDFPELARRDLERYLSQRAGLADAGAVFEHLKALHRRGRTS